MSKLLTKITTRFAALAAALLLTAAPASAPASAQDWVSSILNSQRQQASASTSADRPAKQRTAKAEAPARVAKAEKAAKPTRVAKADTRSSEEDSRPQRRQASKPQPRESLSGGETGVASYYWQPQPLASGGRFNPDALTAAHKTLPFGTRVRVTRLDNGNSVDVTINDRGPYISGRIIDLSRRAAQDISMTGSGVTRVRVSVLGRG